MYLTKPRGSPALSQHRARLGTTAHRPEAVTPTAKTSERTVVEREGQTDSSDLGSEGQGLRTSLPPPAPLVQVLPPARPRCSASTPGRGWWPRVSEPLPCNRVLTRSFTVATFLARFLGENNNIASRVC